MVKKSVGRIVLGIVLFITGILLCSNTVSAYRYFTDWNLGVILPSIMGAGFILYALKIFLIKEPVLKNRRLRMTAIALFTIFCLLFTAIEAAILIDPYTHRPELAGRVDTVLVLGCGIWPDGRPTLSLVERLDKAAAYYAENPHVNIVVSGGKGPNEPFSEAQAMETYLVEKGIPKEKILKEDKSTSTRENFEFSRKVMNVPVGEIKKIIFVTNDFHILRSRVIAKRFGFEAYAISAPTPRVVVLNSYLREFFAFIKSMVLDW